jgi:hypothetical protein
MGSDKTEDRKLNIKARVSLLKKILEMMSDKDFDNTEIIEPLENQNGSSRPSYYSSEERGTYNYGYKEMKEYDY